MFKKKNSSASQKRLRHSSSIDANNSISPSTNVPNSFDSNDDQATIPIKRSSTSKKLAAIRSSTTTQKPPPPQNTEPLPIDHSHQLDTSHAEDVRQKLHDPFANRKRTNALPPHTIAALAAQYEHTSLKPKTDDGMNMDFISLDPNQPSPDLQQRKSPHHRKMGTQYVDVLLSDDPDNDSSNDEGTRAAMRDWELDQIRRGGALDDHSDLSKSAARAVHAIAREGDGRLPDLPTIDSLSISQTKLTSHLTHLHSSHEQSIVAQVTATETEIGRLESETEIDDDLQMLRMDLARTIDLQNHIQDVLEWIYDIEPDLDLWERVPGSENCALAMTDALRDDIKDLNRTLALMSEFKARDRAAYKQSLASDLLFMVVKVYVRLDLLAWDLSSIESRYWHSSVVNFPHTPDRAGSSANDPDAALYRKVVLDVVIPKLRARILNAGPPPVHDVEVLSVKLGNLADRRTLSWLVDTFEEILYAVDCGEHEFQSLIAASLEKVTECITAIPPLCTPAVSVSEMLETISCQYWFITKLKQKYIGAPTVPRLSTSFHFGDAAELVCIAHKVKLAHMALVAASTCILQLANDSDPLIRNVVCVVLDAVRGMDLIDQTTSDLEPNAQTDLILRAAVRALVASGSCKVSGPEAQELMHWMLEVGGMQHEIDVLGAQAFI